MRKVREMNKVGKGRRYKERLDGRETKGERELEKKGNISRVIFYRFHPFLSMNQYTASILCISVIIPYLLYSPKNIIKKTWKMI